MKHLVIHTGHNSTVALDDYETGDLFVISEEKLTNVKNQGGLPRQALDLLSSEGKLRDLTRVTFPHMLFMEPTDPKSVGTREADLLKATLGWKRRVWDEAEYRLAHFDGIRQAMRSFRNLRYYQYSEQVRARLLKEVMEHFPNPKSDVSVDYMLHHDAHCMAPVRFYSLNSQTEPIILVSLDGDGDYLSGKVQFYDPAIDRAIDIADLPYDCSLGYFYGHVTNFLGFRALEHEFKVMGLAGYPDPGRSDHIYQKMRALWTVDEEALTIRSQFNMMHLRRWLLENVRMERFDNVACAAQRVLEDVVLTWIKAIAKREKINRFAFGGGVFMNVKLNQKIAELEEVERCWFMPGAGDESLVFGALKKSAVALDAYRGLPSCANPEWPTATSDRVTTAKIAAIIASGHPVAISRGRAEWGPRALGNRSIVGDPRSMKVLHTINHQIKCRDFWMPFAPAIMEEHASHYVSNWDLYRTKCRESLRFMTVTVPGTLNARESIPAAVHQRDGTLRMQLVSRTSNGSFHELIGAFRDKTGVGALLNTSFNIHGFPLVGTWEQAWNSFKNSGLKYLLSSDTLFTK